MNTSKETISGTNFIYDWKEIWTADEAKHQLKGFVFLGEGWYPFDGNTLLVMSAPQFSNNKIKKYYFIGYETDPRETVKNSLKLSTYN